MVIRRILYHPDFVSDFNKLELSDQRRAFRTEDIFRSNPLYHSLRLHMLKGRLSGFYSISVTLSVRIIFLRQENGDVVFLSIGRHDIYRSL